MHKYASFSEFYPFYLSEHSKPTTRRLHFAGSSLSLACLVLLVLSGDPWWFVGGLLVGYGFAWFAHFFIEKNKPATFEAPVWSLISDWRMCGLWLTGRLGHELMKHQIRG